MIPNKPYKRATSTWINPILKVKVNFVWEKQKSWMWFNMVCPICSGKMNLILLWIPSTLSCFYAFPLFIYLFIFASFLSFSSVYKVVRGGKVKNKRFLILRAHSSSYHYLIKIFSLVLLSLLYMICLSSEKKRLYNFLLSLS